MEKSPFKDMTNIRLQQNTPERKHYRPISTTEITQVPFNPKQGSDLNVTTDSKNDFNLDEGYSISTSSKPKTQ